MFSMHLNLNAVLVYMVSTDPGANLLASSHNRTPSRSIAWRPASVTWPFSSAASRTPSDLNSAGIMMDQSVSLTTNLCPDWSILVHEECCTRADREAKVPHNHKKGKGACLVMTQPVKKDLP